MSSEIEQGLHEKLCAYVLGESEGVDRAEVERELLRSPELRAERERLGSTIGAVRDALAPTETLGADARAALERAVSPSDVRPSPIAQFPWLRLAAGIGAVGLGWWIFAGSQRGMHNDPMVAHLESAAQSAPERERSSGDVELADAQRRADLYAKREGVKFKDELRKLESLGYAGSTEAKKSTEVVRSGTGLVHTDGSTSWNDPATKLASAETKPGQSASSGEAFTGAAVASGGASSPAPTASADPYGGRNLGGGSRKGRPSTVEQAKPFELPSPSQAGNYRGPGDAIPPSSPLPTPPATELAKSGRDNFQVGLITVDAATRQPITVEGLARDDDEALLEEEVGQRGRPLWHELTPAEQAARIHDRYEEIYRGCFPRPNERPRDMFFRFWGDNPFEVTQLDRLSTFSVDVDTASYALARRYLNEGKVPEKAQVRTEEFLNYFPSDVDAPRNATFAVHSDLTPSRFSADAARQMLRVVVRAKDVDKFERQPMHLTFVVDVSGSMKEQNRLETVKNALRTLVAQLDGRDSIALVTFSTDAKLVLRMTPVLDRVAIEAAIAPLQHGGSTNSNAGLQMGYAEALNGLDPNVVNRVVFLSDGVANVGETDAAKILEGVQSIREKGVYLNTIGVGMNNHNDVLLEQLADKGDGMCNYVDSPKEIQRALVDRFTGAFQPIAKDVKIQVEFDPAQVMRYRLLGYENRAIADADFRNDAVDAGEVGAGHQVTALYEIEPTGNAVDAPMATVRLRWKPIRAAGATGVQAATEASFDVSARSYQAFESAPPGHRRALIVAQFAEILRRSIHARGESLDDLIVEARKLQVQIPSDADFAEFVDLLQRSKDAILRTMPACDELCQTIDALRSNVYLGTLVEQTGREPRSLEEIETSRREIEARLRDVLRKQAEKDDGFQKLESLGYSRGK